MFSGYRVAQPTRNHHEQPLKIKHLTLFSNTPEALHSAGPTKNNQSTGAILLIRNTLHTIIFYRSSNTKKFASPEFSRKFFRGILHVCFASRHPRPLRRHRALGVSIIQDRLPPIFVFPFVINEFAWLVAIGWSLDELFCC